MSRIDYDENVRIVLFLNNLYCPFLKEIMEK